MSNNIWEDIAKLGLVKPEPRQPALTTPAPVEVDPNLAPLQPLFKEGLSLVFDTETTGLVDWKAPLNASHQPDVIQLAAVLGDEHKVYLDLYAILDPSNINPGWQMTQGAQDTHGISREQVLAEGIPTELVLKSFAALVQNASVLVCHNSAWDSKLMAIAYNRADDTFNSIKMLEKSAYYCTMQRSTQYCQQPFLESSKSFHRKGQQQWKWPQLEELHQKLFGEGFTGAHDAMNDVLATRRCYYELRRLGI